MSTADPVDYKRLLWLYIGHVGACEGINFLHPSDRYYSGDHITDEEWAELVRLGNQAEEMVK